MTIQNTNYEFLILNFKFKKFSLRENNRNSKFNIQNCF